MGHYFSTFLEYGDVSYSILLCDDNLDVGANWVSEVRAVVTDEYTVMGPPTNTDVREAAKGVFARQTAFRGGDARDKKHCLFDDADILVLDYDLLHIDENNARHTGEALARLVRMFSNPDVVLVVNQFREAQFDLSLRGHLSSHADLNLDAELLGKSGLWTDPPWQGFRPWHWQTLSRAVELQKARQAVVRDHMDKAIVDVLGMQDEDIAHLSDTAFGFIAPNAKELGSLQAETFESFTRTPANAGDASELLTRNPDAACRYLAARIGKWLERQVLGPQDVLVDIPHLIQRYPFLLGDDVSELEAWNAAIHDEQGMRKRVPPGCWFGPLDFLSRPAVWRQRFEDEADIRKARYSFDFSTVPSFVFLEDTSTFVPLDEAIEFRSGHHNSFDRRFAKCIDGITYAPQRRLAFAER